MPETGRTPHFLELVAGERQRSFTNRHRPLALLSETFREVAADSPAVVNIYGVGGIGKSALLRRFHETVAETSNGPTALLDLQHPAYRRPDAAISSLRNSLAAKYKLHFPRYDIAYAVYWQRANPSIPLVKARQNFLLEKSDVLSAVGDAASGVPVFGAATSLLQILGRSARGAKRWRRIRNDENLQKLDELDLEGLIAGLGFFFATDLVEALTSHDERALLLIDAHEALWDDVATVGGLVSRDAWLRDLVAQLDRCLVVVASRDELSWPDGDKYWSHDRFQRIELTDFSVDDCTSFVTDCAVEDPTIVNAIVEASGGVPFFLNLAIDAHERIATARSPLPSDFESFDDLVLQRFLGHLPRGEDELLKVLGVLRFWDRGVCEYLVRSFNVPYSFSRWDDLEHFSFIRSQDAGEFRLHQLMRNALVAQLPSRLQREVHTAAYTYYREEAEAAVGPTGVRALREAAYHGTRSQSLDHVWFGERSCVVLDHGGWLDLPTILDEIDEATDDSEQFESLRSVVRYLRARVARWSGNVGDAYASLQAIDSDSAPAFAGRVRLELAHAAREAGDTEVAADLYEEIRGAQYLDHERVRANGTVWVGDILLVRGKFAEAEDALAEAISTAADDGEFACSAQARRLAGHVARFAEQRDLALERYTDAEEHFAALGDAAGLAEISTNLVETLAVLDPSQALEVAAHALKANEQAGHRIELGKILTASAQAYLCLREAEAAGDAVGAAIDALGAVGYRSGRARALLTRGFLRAQIGDRAGAADDAREAVKEFKAVDVYPTLIIAADLLCTRVKLPDTVAEQDVAAARASLTFPTGWDGFDTRLEAAVERLLG